MPRRPHPPASSTASVSQHSAVISESSETEGSTSGSPWVGITPEARYQHNLKVLRRRDPTILSIFDQFSHICLYKLEGGKWERMGCEGSMFLFESSTYPPYGYYILNRAGNTDHIARLYPEDFISGPVGSMTAIRHFDTFTEHRLASIKASLRPGEPLPGPFDPRYMVPDVERLSEGMKTTAEHSMVGLWYHASGSRDPLDVVMMRLQSYNRRNERYPDQFRYTSSHPAPNRLRAAPGSHAMTSASESENETVQSKSPEPPQPTQSNQLANLLAGLNRSSASTSTAPQAQPPPQGTTNSAIDSLFANALASRAPPPPPPPPAAPPMLTALFASASAPPQQHPQQQPHLVHAPIPGTSNGHTGGPQIFDQTVLNTLMGGIVLPRSASSASMRSHATSRDGDNEGEATSDDDDESPTSTTNGYHHQGQKYGGTRPAGQAFLSVPGTGGGFGAGGGSGGVRGDATPRAFQARDLKSVPAPSVIESVSSNATVRPSHYPSSSQSSQHQQPQHHQQTQQQQPPRVNRQLVPFADDSELWPYPNESGGGSSGSADEIVELSFEETSLLSDPDALFAHNGLKKNGAGRNGVPPLANTNVNGTPSKNSKKKGRKESVSARKERDAQERREIERSWDVPEYVAAQQQQQGGVRRGSLSSPPASPSPPPSVKKVQQTPPAASKKGGPLTDAARAKVAAASSQPLPETTPPAMSNGKGKAKANGVVAVNGKHVGAVGLDKGAVKGAIVSGMAGRKVMDRNEFVRGVLDLIHNDKNFVDSLYQQYLANAN